MCPAGGGARAQGRAFHCSTRIPVAAGVGGGSADAAAALRLLARLNGIALDDARMMPRPRSRSAPMCRSVSWRAPASCAGWANGCRRRSLPSLPAVLVNPGVPLATRDVFAKFTGEAGGPESLGDVPHALDALIDFLGRQGNDLTDAAIACVPVIADLLEALRAMPGVRLSRMSGSGPTCFAIFGSRDEASAAAQRLTAAHTDWWIAPANLASML